MMPENQGAGAMLAHSRYLIRSVDRCYRNMHPRDAACLVIVDNDDHARPRILMGRRRPDLAFMPDRLVFPGGRVEASDYLAAGQGMMPRPLLSKLMAHTPPGKRTHRQRGLALAHAALRETEEETGLRMSVRGAGAVPRQAPSDFSSWSFLARAITPPRFARRFDTRFFTVSAKHIVEETPLMDGEFVAIEWLTFGEARRGAAHITRIILDDLERCLMAGSPGDQDAPVPFYFMRGACFHRILL